jgi:probable O-glycosylation ligase (exosortase A-associated)
MKQYLVLLALSAFGVFGSFLWTPYIGVSLYYMYAVMRPQYLWKWQLAGAPALLPWSFVVAVASILGYVAWAGGLMSFGRRETSLMRFRAKFTVAHWAMMAFATQVTLSFLFSNDMYQSQNWYGEYMKIFGMYFLASRVVRTAGQVRGLYILVTLAIGYVAWEMNAIYLQTGKLIIARDGFAGLDNNGAGLLLALGVPLCYFAWEFTQHRVRWFFLLLIPVIVHAVGSSYSRGAMLSILAALPFYFLYSRKRKFLTVLALAGLASLPVLFGKEIQERFFSVKKSETDDSFQVRVQSWRIAVEIANDYPVTGAGIRCSNAEMWRRGADMEGRTIHSQYLQIAADSGWPALALYMVMTACTFYTIWRARLALWRRTDPESVRAVALLGGVECAIISFLIGAFALSLEVFEVAYLLFFLGAQVWGLVNATDTLATGYRPPIQVTVPARRPTYQTAYPRGTRR